MTSPGGHPPGVSDARTTTRDDVLAIALPVATVGAATLVVLPWNQPPLMLSGSTYLLAVVACAMFGGRASGFAATLLATGAAAAVVASADDLLGLAAFIPAAAAVTIVLDRARSARDVASHATQRFAAVVDASPVAVVVLDVDGRVEVWNHAAEAVFGWRASEVLGKPNPLIPPGDAPSWTREVLRPVLGGATFTAVETRRLRKDGTLVDVLLSAAPIRADDGTVVGGVGVLADLRLIRRGEQERAALRAREEHAMAQLAESGARLASIIATTVDAIITIESDGRIDTFNHAAERLFGYRADEVRGRNVSMLMPPPDREQHDDYLQRYLSGGTPHIIGIGRHVVAQRSDGSLVPVHLSVSEVRLADRVVFTGVVRDVSDDVLAVRRAEELQGLTAGVAAALEPQEVAARVVETVVRYFHAHGGHISLLGTDGRLSVLRAARGDDAARIGSEGRTPAAVALRTRAPVLVSDVGHEAQRWDVDDAVRAFVALPLLYEGAAIGALVLTFARPTELSDDDARFLATAAAIAAAALSRARLHAAERRIATTLQRSMLPATLPEMPGVQLAAAYQPGTTGMQIGGDWYDAVSLPGDRLALAIGDVAGHGIEAAAVMARVRSAYHALAHVVDSPAALLAELNEQLVHDADNPFVTCCTLVVDLRAHTITYAIAGHPPPVVSDPSGSRLLGGAVGTPLATRGDVAYPEHVAPFEVPAALVVYTDGLVERRGESLDVGLERLVRASEAARDSAQDLCDQLLAALRPETAFDDAAVVVARFDPVC